MFTRVATLIVLSSAPVVVTAQTPTNSSTLASRVDAVFKNFDQSTSPGCAVAAYQDDRILYRRAYGMANLDHDVPLTPASVFHVASVSKQFTAAAILLLAAEGKLSIDDDVRKYIPELPDYGRTITIRHLAHHTSGIRDQWALLGLAGWRYSNDLITDNDVLTLLARQQGLNFPPGERHLYSNSGYTLLALIVRRVSGQSFREFTTERIFKPLGMSKTHFRDRFTEVVKGQAYGYEPDRGGFRLSVTNFDTAGATSLLTTVEDMARWHANFDARKVGSDGLISALLERGVLNDGRTIDYAFGVEHGLYRGVATISHGGSDAGYRAGFMRFPEQRFGVAVLCNVATAAPLEYARRVADVYLAGKLKPLANQTPLDAEEVPVSPQQLKTYAGVYLNAADGVARRIMFDNGRLFAIRGVEPISLKSLGEGRFLMTGTPEILTFETAAVTAPRLRIPALDVVLERIDPVTPTTAQLQEFAGVYRSDEMDTVFRVVLRDGRLDLERAKVGTAALPPLASDTFGGQAGVIRFVRDAAGKVSGLQVSILRAHNVKFWKDISPARKESGR